MTDTTEATKLVDFAALIRKKKAETQEAQIAEMIDKYRQYVSAVEAEVEYVRKLIERAYLLSDINETTAQLAVEKESLRIARQIDHENDVAEAIKKGIPIHEIRDQLDLRDNA